MNDTNTIKSVLLDAKNFALLIAKDNSVAIELQDKAKCLLLNIQKIDIDELEFSSIIRKEFEDLKALTEN